MIHVGADHTGHHEQDDQPDLVGYLLRAVVDAAREACGFVVTEPALAGVGGQLLERC